MYVLACSRRYPSTTKVKGTAVWSHLQKFWIISVELSGSMPMARRFKRIWDAKLALERRFGRPDGAKLALDRRFGQPDGAALALDRRVRTTECETTKGLDLWREAPCT